MKKIFMRFIIIPIACTVIIYFTIAFGLLLSQSSEKSDNPKTLSFEGVDKVVREISLENYTAKDGTQLGVRHIAAKTDNAPLVIIIHGSGWHGGGYQNLSNYMSEKGDFEILLPDLRGHGKSSKTPGDVAYIGQLEDDLADLIAAYKKPDQEVIMIGHSSGGGLVIRFAGGKHGSMLDKAVLMAPFLKYNAQTMRENAGGWNHVLTRRIIGLSMLNAVGITYFNGMTVIQFNFPKTIIEGPLGDSATQSYSYRLNTSFAPRENYLDDIAALPEFLVVVGADDDAFFADKFEPTMAAVNDKGTYVILPNADHIGMINNDKNHAAIMKYLQR